MMKLVPYDRKKIENVGGYKASNNLEILTEFVESNMDCAKVDEWTTHDATHCAASLRASIKRYGFNGIAAISRKGNVYLIKTNT